MTMTFNRRSALQMTGAAALALGAGVTPLRAAPKRGGTLRLGLRGGSSADSFDGRTHTDTFMLVAGMGGAYDTLTMVDADGTLTGELAESWEATADAKTWTFKLRKGVEFHNGKSFGADDAMESLNMHLGEDSKSAAKPIIEAIDTMKKLDEHTVRITLKAGNADFPFQLSDYHILMYPAGMIDEAIAKGIGTGGMVVESFEPGVRCTMVKNPNDYLGDSRVFFDAVEMISIADGSARLNALMTGEVDMINYIEPKAVSLLSRNPNVFISEVTGNQHYTFPMHTNTAPFDNPDFRLALKYGIDREAMVEKILFGHGAVSADNPIGPANTYYDASLKREYDLDKAKFHLEKSGLAGTKIDLSVAEAAFPGAIDAGALYQASMKPIGVDINLVREPNDGYWSNVWLKKPFSACYWGGRATEDWMFSTTYASGVPWNDTYWEHERFNKLLMEARAELDTAKRSEIYTEMQGIVSNEGGAVIPMYANYVDGASTKLANSGTVGNIWALDSCRVIERWWFA